MGDCIAEKLANNLLHTYTGVLPISIIDKIGLSLAEYMASMSKCDRANVGAVIIDTYRLKVLGSGFNSPPEGHPTCEEAGHLMFENSCKRTIHAEINALFDALSFNHPARIKESILYVTHEPCPDCLKLLGRAGIKEIVYEKDYPHKYENNFGDNIKIRKFKQ